jgi:mono/diheme cytochrome c family protein
MKSVMTGLITIALALIAAACSRPVTQTTNSSAPVVVPTPAASATLQVLNTPRGNFEKHCVACHGVGGEGGTITVDNKTLNVPSLTKGHALTHNDEQLAKTITNGENEMPAFKDKLSPTDIFALVNFIRKELQGK